MVEGLGFRGLGLRDQGLGCRIQGLGVRGTGFRAYGLEFRDQAQVHTSVYVHVCMDMCMYIRMLS
jgi:hypothetical protein